MFDGSAQAVDELEVPADVDALAEGSAIGSGHRRPDASVALAPDRGDGEFVGAPAGPGDRLGPVHDRPDMARFGLLVQRRGRRGDGQVVPGHQLDRALTASTDLHPSYGELWWLNGQDGWGSGPRGRLRPGPLLPDAPPDVVGALGAGDQRVFVRRDARLVVVPGDGPGAGLRRRALAPAGGGPLDVSARLPGDSRRAHRHQ